MTSASKRSAFPPNHHRPDRSRELPTDPFVAMAILRTGARGTQATPRRQRHLCGSTRSLRDGRVTESASSSRPVELEPRREEGVLPRVVEAERTGAEHLHDQRPRRLRGAEDEALRHVHADVLLLARHRIGERRQGHLDVPGNTERALAAVDRELDGREDRVLDRAHRAAEERERTVALGLAGEDADERVALLGRSALRDVEPQRSATLVDRARPRGRVDHVEAVQARLAETSLPHVVGDERFAEAAGGIAAEVAGACEGTVAGLDVVDLHLPAGRLLVTGPDRRLLPLRLRHRVLLGEAVYQGPRAAGYRALD